MINNNFSTIFFLMNILPPLLKVLFQQHFLPKNGYECIKQESFSTQKVDQKRNKRHYKTSKFLAKLRN